MQRCLVSVSVKYYMKFPTWDMHSAWGCGSQTPREAHSRMGAHSSKLWPYTRNWAKSRGWALFREWALFHETMVTISKTNTHLHPWVLMVLVSGDWLGLLSQSSLHHLHLTSPWNRYITRGRYIYVVKKFKMFIFRLDYIMMNAILGASAWWADSLDPRPPHFKKTSAYKIIVLP